MHGAEHGFWCWLQWQGNQHQPAGVFTGCNGLLPPIALGQVGAGSAGPIEGWEGKSPPAWSSSEHTGQRSSSYWSGWLWSHLVEQGAWGQTEVTSLPKLEEVIFFAKKFGTFSKISYPDLHYQYYTHSYEMAWGFVPMLQQRQQLTVNNKIGLSK